MSTISQWRQKLPKQKILSSNWKDIWTIGHVQNHCSTLLRRILRPIVLSKKKPRILSEQKTAEQALVNALTRFHKRRLDSLRNKLESRPTFSSRKRTHVNRQSRSESQSASNIVNNDNVKLAELEKRIIDLTNIVSADVISTNKRVESYCLYITVCTLAPDYSQHCILWTISNHHNPF